MSASGRRANSHVVPGLMAAACVVAIRLALAFMSDEVLLFDELRQGIYGHARRHGAAIPLLDVWFYPYEGWVVFHAWITSLLQGVFPPEGALVKVTTLLTGALQAWLLVWLAAQAGGRRAANLAAILLVGSPVAFTVLGVYGYGGHFESTVTEVMVIAAAVDWAQRTDPGRRRAILVGLLAVWAIFVHPSGLLAVATAAVVMVAGVRTVDKQNPREWRYAIGAAVLAYGLVVLVQDVWLRRSSSNLMQLYATLFRREVEGQSSAALVERFRILLEADLPNSLYPWPFLPVLGLGLIGSAVNLVHGWRKGSPAHVAASAFPAVVFVIGFVGTVAPGSPAFMATSAAYRYHLHAMVPLILTLAVFAGDRAWPRWADVAVLALAGGLAAWSVSVQLDRIPDEAWRVERPILLEADATWMARAELKRPIEDVCRAFQDPVQRGLCFRGISMNQLGTCEGLSVEETMWCQEGRGLALGVKAVIGALIFDPSGLPDVRRRVLEECAGPFASICLRAVGDPSTILMPDLSPTPDITEVTLDGAGMFLGTQYAASPCFAQARCSHWAAGHASRCEEGVARRVGQFAGLQSPDASMFTCDDETPNPTAQAEGLGEGWGTSMGLEGGQARCEEALPAYAAACRTGVRRVLGLPSTPGSEPSPD